MGRFSSLASRVALVTAVLLQQQGASGLAARSRTTRMALGPFGGPKVSAPEGFQAPEPKPLSVTRGDWLPVVASGTAALAARLGTGIFVSGWRPRIVSPDDVPEGEYALKLGPIAIKDYSSTLADARKPAKPLVLYEYEASPFCRKVREALSMLDLEVTFLPCPGARQGFASELERKGGKMMVPYLEDPNSGVGMYESDDIIAYLFDTYGPGQDQVPWQLKGGFALQSSVAAAMARGFAGSRMNARARESNGSMKPIELWGYEGSPFVRPVREKLGELGLPHTMVFCPRGSANRDRLVQKTGRFQVPFISDPNTGVDMFESPEICEYLEEVYTE